MAMLSVFSNGTNLSKIFMCKSVQEYSIFIFFNIFIKVLGEDSKDRGHICR